MTEKLILFIAIAILVFLGAIVIFAIEKYFARLFYPLTVGIVLLQIVCFNIILKNIFNNDPKLKITGVFFILICCAIVLAIKALRSRIRLKSR